MSVGRSASSTTMIDSQGVEVTVNPPSVDPTLPGGLLHNRPGCLQERQGKFQPKECSMKDDDEVKAAIPPNAGGDSTQLDEHAAQILAEAEAAAAAAAAAEQKHGDDMISEGLSAADAAAGAGGNSLHESSAPIIEDPTVEELPQVSREFSRGDY